MSQTKPQYGRRRRKAGRLYSDREFEHLVDVLGRGRQPDRPKRQQRLFDETTDGTTHEHGRTN